MSAAEHEPISIFLCGAPKEKAPPCGVSGCTAESVTLCHFKLRGRAAGKTCPKPLCEAHIHRLRYEADDDGNEPAPLELCPAHWEFMVPRS